MIAIVALSHVNICRDLFFASYIPEAAAALSYARLLAETSRGIQIITLAMSIVRVVYERQAFDKQASELAAFVFITYKIRNS